MPEINPPPFLIFLRPCGELDGELCGDEVVAADNAAVLRHAAGGPLRLELHTLGGRDVNRRVVRRARGPRERHRLSD